MNPIFNKDDIVRYVSKLNAGWFDKKFRVIRSKGLTSDLICLEDILPEVKAGMTVRLANINLERCNPRKERLQLELFNDL